MARSIASAVRGASGMVTTLPPLPSTVRVRWPAFETERLDVGAEGFGDTQAVDGQERRGLGTARFLARNQRESSLLLSIVDGGAGKTRPSFTTAVLSGRSGVNGRCRKVTTSGRTTGAPEPWLSNSRGLCRDRGRPRGRPEAEDQDASSGRPGP